MEPGPNKPSSMGDNIRGFVKSSETVVKSAFRKSLDSNILNPIDILKRLQREAYAELMKLKDRQEKIEKMLLFHKLGKGSPFKESATYVKVAISLAGSFVFFEDGFFKSPKSRESPDWLAKFADCSGIKSGVNSRFIFETAVRERDLLMAEFATSSEINTGGSLSLATLMYCARVNDWLSLVLFPLGAQCNYLRMDSGFKLGYRDDLSSNGPSLFHKNHNCASGLTLKFPKFAASIAELVSSPSVENTASMNNCKFVTFGQISYKPLEDVRISLSGLWQIQKVSARFTKLANLAIPLTKLRNQAGSGSGSELAIQTSNIPAQSIALMLDAEYDESTKLEGWIEVEKSTYTDSVKWGVTVSDTPRNELGWGIRTGGISRASLNLDNFHAEGFLNFDLGRGAKLQPGLVYVKDGGSSGAALVFRSFWFM